MAGSRSYGEYRPLRAGKTICLAHSQGEALDAQVDLILKHEIFGLQAPFVAV